MNAVLKEIGADGKPTLMVFNKMDQLNGNAAILPRFLERHPNAVAISAMDGEGLPALMARNSAASFGRFASSLNCRFLMTERMSLPDCTRSGRLCSAITMVKKRNSKPASLLTCMKNLPGFL